MKNLAFSNFTTLDLELAELVVGEPPKYEKWRKRFFTNH